MMDQIKSMISDTAAAAGGTDMPKPHDSWTVKVQQSTKCESVKGEHRRDDGTREKRDCARR